MRTAILLGFALGAAAQVAVLDRIAVIVGKNVITEREVLKEIRLTAFLNGQGYDFSPAAKRGAAERLVDQVLIRQEMSISGFTPPKPDAAAKMLENLIATRFHGSETAFRQALQKYELTRQDVEAHLLWELTALRFTDYRFQRLAMALNQPEALAANGAAAQAESTPSVDQQMDAWLKQQRSRTRITFRSEAFQ